MTPIDRLKSLTSGAAAGRRAMARRMAGMALAAIVGAAIPAGADPTPPDGSATRRGEALVIGHRGASGYLPEHTLAGYELAIKQCAAFIEPDLVSTSDGVLVARHENEISGTTNVADRVEFAGRRTTKTIDGVAVTGWFTEDFTLAELKTLRAKERIPEVRPQNAAQDGKFPIPTLHEVIDLAKSSRTCDGKAVGVYPETKHPSYFRSIGLPMEDELVRVLHANGYEGRQAPVFIQSFEVSNLQALAKKTELPLVQLIDCSGRPADFAAVGDPRTYADLVTPSGLSFVATYAQGIGSCKDVLIPRRPDGTLAQASPVIHDAHDAGLVVHGWTFRRENRFLPANFRRGTDPNAPGDMVGEVRAFLAAGMDGFFTDNPDLGVEAAGAHTGDGETPPGQTVDVQLLALNDFHGNLEPPGGPIAGSPAGGAEYLATHVRQRRATNPNTMVVSAGDLIGASPLVSALFRDEPTIEAMNMIGLDLNAVGNHEFDKGSAELLRMQNGGCNPVDGCLDGDPFAGAKFGFLAANVVRSDTHETLFPAYAVREFQGAKVAFIGLTLKDTPSIVTPSGVAGLEFLDEADTVNALVPELRRQGIESIVVLMHEGGRQTGGINDCKGASGPVVDIVNRMDDAVDVVVSGHTHQAYKCVIDGKLVTSASSFGRVLTDIDLTIDKRTGDVVKAGADNFVVTRNVPRAGDLTALIAKYKAISAPLENRVIGTITADITRNATPAGESALGDVVADAQLAATSGPAVGGAVVAFMNPGGIRADLSFAPSGAEQPGQVTYGEAFTVQPFGNTLVTMTLTGAQLDTLLEQQWCNQAFPRILQVSAGFTYTWDNARPACNRVDPSTIRIGGASVTPTGTYRVTVNSFLADGGDNFTVLRSGVARLGGPLDLDALEPFFKAGSPIPPGPRNRISRLG